MDCVDKCGGKVDLGEHVTSVGAGCGGSSFRVYACGMCGRLHFHHGSGVENILGKAYWNKDKGEIFHKNENDSK